MPKEKIRLQAATLGALGFVGFLFLWLFGWAVWAVALRALLGRQDILTLVAVVPGELTGIAAWRYLRKQAAEPAFAQYGLHRILDSKDMEAFLVRVSDAFWILERYLRLRLGPNFFEDFLLRPAEDEHRIRDDERPRNFRQLARALSSAWVSNAAGEGRPWPSVAKHVFELTAALRDPNADESFRLSINKLVAEIDPWFRRRALDYGQDSVSRYLGAHPYFLPIVGLVLSAVLAIFELVR